MDEAGYSLVMTPVEEEIKERLYKAVKCLKEKFGVSVNKVIKFLWRILNMYMCELYISEWIYVHAKYIIYLL